MLSIQENEDLTRVGPGTPMGELLRRYWHPVAASAQLWENPTKAVRILGESLVLYRDRGGKLGLIGESCPHRRVNLLYGIPEQEGLRCPYHGWLFDETGRCLEMPAEAPDSTFKDRVSTTAYPVQEMAGLVFAYLGPAPAPLPPRYDVYAAPNVVREIGGTVLPCNWLQCMENTVDPVHVEWLHQYYVNYLRGAMGKPPLTRDIRRHKKIGFNVFEHGIVKRRVLQGEAEDSDFWQIGHPLVFPNILRNGSGGESGYMAFQVRVPLDDTHTWQLFVMAYRPGIPTPPQERVPYFDVPYKNDDGRFITDFIDGQDMFAWVSQGPVAERHLEKLGESDVGITLYRRLLKEQMDRVRRGQDPMEVYRDPAENELIELFHETMREPGAYRKYKFTGGHMKYSPSLGEVQELYRQAEALEDAGEPLHDYTPPPRSAWESSEPRLRRESSLFSA